MRPTIERPGLPCSFDPARIERALVPSRVEGGIRGRIDVAVVVPGPIEQNEHVAFVAVEAGTLEKAVFRIRSADEMCEVDGASGFTSTVSPSAVVELTTRSVRDNIEGKALPI